MRISNFVKRTFLFLLEVGVDFFRLPFVLLFSILLYIKPLFYPGIHLFLFAPAFFQNVLPKPYPMFSEFNSLPFFMMITLTYMINKHIKTKSGQKLNNRYRLLLKILFLIFIIFCFYIAFFTTINWNLVEPKTIMTFLFLLLIVTKLLNFTHKVIEIFSTIFLPFWWYFIFFTALKWDMWGINTILIFVFLWLSFLKIKKLKVEESKSIIQRSIKGLNFLFIVIGYYLVFSVYTKWNIWEVRTLLGYLLFLMIILLMKKAKLLERDYLALADRTLNFSEYFYFLFIFLAWYYIICAVLLVYPWFIFVILVIFSVVLIYYRSRRLKGQEVIFCSIFFPTCFLSLTLMLLIFMKGLHNCNLIKKQQALIPYANFCHAGWEKPFLEIISKERQVFNPKVFKESRWLQRIGEYIYVGPTGTTSSKQTYTFILSATNGKVLNRIKLEGGTFSTAYFPDKDLLALAQTYRHRVGLFQLGKTEPIRIINFKRPRPFWVEIDNVTKKLIIGLDHSKYQLVIYDLMDLKLREKFIVLSHGGATTKMDINHKSHIVYFLSLFGGKNHQLISLNTKNLKVMQEKNLAFFPIDVYYDSTYDKVFVLYPFYSFFYGLLTCHSPYTLEESGRELVPMGSWRVVSDKRGMLYIANYITGKIKRFDWRKRKIEKGEVFVGKKIRSLKYDPQYERLYVASSNGFFGVDLKKWSKESIHD